MHERFCYSPFSQRPIQIEKCYLEYALIHSLLYKTCVIPSCTDHLQKEPSSGAHPGGIIWLLVWALSDISLTMRDNWAHLFGSISYNRYLRWLYLSQLKGRLICIKRPLFCMVKNAAG